MKDYTIFAISDGTAATVRLVIQAVLAQFPQVSVKIKSSSHIKTEEEVYQIIQEAAEVKGLIVYTLVSPLLREKLIHEVRIADVLAVDLLGPLLYRMEDFFNLQPKGIPGIFKPCVHEYDSKIEAVNFTVDHDDGQNPNTLDQADIVILGVSRTSKTPLSIYLSSRGWKIANIPVIPGVEPPAKLYQIDQRKIIALTIKPERLSRIRQNRMEKFSLPANNTYSSLEAVQREVSLAEEFYRTGASGWPIIDVTNKSIEEMAQEVIIILTQRGLKNSMGKEE